MEMPMSMSMPYGRWQMDKADKRLVHRAVSCVKGRGARGGSHPYPGTSIIYVCQYFPPHPTLTACSSLFIYRFTQLNIVCLCATL